MSHKTTFIDRCHRHESLVGIIGLGYVGLPLMLRFIEAGFRVLGFDVDPRKVAQLNAGGSYIGHISAGDIQQALAKGFSATSDISRAGEPDALLICVPTPLNQHREPDLTYVKQTTESIAPFVRAGQMVCLESTTYPGTTEEEMRPRLETQGWTVGEDLFLVYSPEREDPGNPKYNTRTIPKVVGGTTPACLEAGCALYGEVIDSVVPVSSTRAAELVKLLENIHRAVNIGLANEMKMIADKMGLDIFEVINAAATKPFGFVPYTPGPGLGGHCIPIDPFYLTWKAREYEVHTRFIELAGEINSSMPEWVIGKVIAALNDRGRAVRGSRILVLGLAYKKDVDDMRESPSVVLMEKLERLGAEVAYSDPHVPEFPPMRGHSFDLQSEPLTPENLASFDCVLLSTNHTAFDYDSILAHAQLVVDTRGQYHRVQSPKLVKA